MTEPNHVVVGQNKQLRQQVKALQARAFESSRWWRVYPRFTLARLRSVADRATANEGSAAAPRAQERRADGLATRLRAKVVDRGRLSEDWFTTHTPAWEPVLRKLDDRPSRLLELRSFVRRLVGNTRDVLPKLVAAGEQFDFVDIDESHEALDALVDSALSWQLLTQGGLAIFDDYGPIPLGEDPALRPVAAIDAFVTVVRGDLEIVSSERQPIVRKVA
jgi:hypothetical protein